MIPGSCHQILARSLSHVLLLHTLPFAIECLRLERDQCNIMRGQRWASQSNKVRLSGVRVWASWLYLGTSGVGGQATGAGNWNEPEKCWVLSDLTVIHPRVARHSCHAFGQEGRKPSQPDACSRRPRASDDPDIVSDCSMCPRYIKTILSVARSRHHVRTAAALRSVFAASFRMFGSGMFERDGLTHEESDESV